jgi:hypothetical protein
LGVRYVFGHYKNTVELGKGREMVSPCWFMEEMGKRRLRIGGKDGKPSFSPLTPAFHL